MPGPILRSLGNSLSCLRHHVFLLSALALLASGTQLLSQGVVLNGSLIGRVTDQTSAAIPGATVTLQNQKTGVKTTVETGSTGLYSFLSLAPGSYSLRAAARAFSAVDTQVEVRVGSSTTQTIALPVSTGTEQVSISAETPSLHSDDSSTSTVLQRSFMQDLPLNGRKYTNFALLTPNTAPDGDTGLVGVAGQQGGEDSGYANGNGSNAFTVDGTNATSNYFDDILGRYRIPYLFGEDAIEEFQVTISPYSAIYGGGAGFVNAVTRSGGKAFHGSAFYYNRNSATGANDALDKSAGLPRPEDQLQQFGVGFGGPIRQDHLWYFFDFEQQLRNNPLPVINPTLATNPATLPSFLTANFGIPAGTPLPAPNGPLPIPGTDTAPDPTNPVYLQQVANAMNAINRNLGVRPRQRNDFVATPRLDWQARAQDSVFLSGNLNLFKSPGGVITDPNEGGFGTETAANANVHDVLVTLGWNHTFSPRLLNEFHAGTSQDNQISTPTGLAPNAPTIILDSPSSFILGNGPFSVGRVFERQWSASDRVNLLLGKHTLQVGFEFSRATDSDKNDGGADPNAAVQNGSSLGSYQFSNLQSFALGQYASFSQNAGNPTFAFDVPYYAFYLQDAYHVLPRLTLDLGLREDFQIYPQPSPNPAFPLTGQFPNRYQRLAPRFGFAWSPTSHTVVRGGIGDFYTNLNGLNYRNTVIANGLPSQQASASTSYTSGAPNQQLPVFPNILPASSPLFSASSNISLVGPDVKAPNILEASLQVELELSRNTTLTLGTMWNHAVHLLASSAYDLNLQRPQGTTQYIVCPPNVVTLPCSGKSIVLPTLDSGLLGEGRISSTFGQINELISPGQNNYNSLFVQFERKDIRGLSVQASYTFAKSLARDGSDFNNQFDLSNTHGPTLQDQRHRLSIATVYRPHLEQIARANFSPVGRAILSGWALSNVLEASSGRPYAGLLSPACTLGAPAVGNTSDLLQQCSGANNNLNDSAFLEATSNSAAGINGAGPSPGVDLNSFYGPWLERLDGALSRTFPIREGMNLKLEAQGFNLFNHANWYVQNGNGINQLQYNPVGQNCGDGQSTQQQCYLVPNTGAGNFGTLSEISPNGLPRVFQFAARFTF